MKNSKVNFEDLNNEIFNVVIQEYGDDLENLCTLNENEFGEEIHNILSRISHDITNAIINQEY